MASESCTFVSDWLNKRGYRTKLRSHCDGKVCGGRLYAPLQVRRILTSPYYKGCVTHKGNIYPGEHEAIVDEEIWNHIQTLFRQYNETIANGQRRKGYATATPSFLKGILKCAKCNVAMTPTYAYNHGLRYRYYVCSNHIRHKTCGLTFKTVPAEDVEEKVIQEILRILRSPEIVSTVNRIADEHASKTGNTQVSKQNLVLALKNLTEVWTFLYSTEQHKIVRMLVKEALIGDDGLRLKMNLDGFDRVMAELAAG